MPIPQTLNKSKIKELHDQKAANSNWTDRANYDISPIGVVELHRLSIEPLRVKYYSERLKVGEFDRRRDWDLDLVAENKQAMQHYIKKARV